MTGRVLRAAADLVIGSPRAVTVGCAVALVAAAAGIAWGVMHLETDYLALLPEDKPQVRLFREAVRDFGTLDYLLALVTVPEGEDASDHGEALDALAKALRASPHVSAVEYKLDFESPLARFLMQHVLLFLDADALAEAEAKLTDEGIAAQVGYYRKILSTPASSQVKVFLRFDPLGLMPLLRSRLTGNRPSMGMDLSEGYYLSRDRGAALMIVKPVRPAQDVEFDVKLLADLERRVADVLNGLPTDVPRPEVRFGGGHAIALDDYRILKRDAAVNISSSFLSVLTLFAFALGGIATIRYAAIPLGLGVLLTGGLGGVILGSFNPATAGFAALLIGLAVDHVIVMLGRYAEERGAGAPPESAARTIIEKTGRSVALGSVTTAATFLALCSVDFKGLSDLGLLAGLGILVCFGVILVVLPHMLLRASRRGREVTEQRLRSFGLERATLVARRAPRATLAAAAVATAASLLLAPRIRFEDDLKALRAEGNRGIEVQQEVTRRFGGGFDHAMLITRGATIEELLERSARLDRELEGLVGSGVIEGFDSITRYVPPVAAQERVLARVADLRASSFDPDRVEASLRKHLAGAGFRTDVLEGSVASAVSALRIDAPIDIDELRRSDLGPAIERYVRADGESMKAVAHVFPSGGTFRRHVPEPLKQAAAAAGADLTGVTAMSEAVRTGIRGQAISALALGLVMVTLLVALDFRSVSVSAIVMTPLLVGVVWMLGVMTLANVSFNFFNVFVATMILGIGVDYSIHATHRYLEGDRRDFEAAFLHTGRAIVIAAMTTMLGFGSFATSHYRGLFSIGVVAIIGTTTCLAASFTVLPALLCLTHPPRRRRTPPVVMEGEVQGVSAAAPFEGVAAVRRSS